MGSRGSFVSVNTGNFTFVENGQRYRSIGEIDGAKVLIQTTGAVKAPEYSHTANRIYAVVQNGVLKHLAFYDENHKQVECVDFTHCHGSKQMRPHKHLYLDHSDDGIKPSQEQITLANKIRRQFKVK